MYIFNKRNGFATNSSSTHSVLELPKTEDMSKIRTDEYESFHWDFFTAADNESKINYLACLINLNLEQIGYSKKKSSAYIANLFGPDVAKNVADISIDHQSVLSIPVNWDSTTLNQDFVKELVQYVTQENIVILGGNDNTEEEHNLIDRGESAVISALPRESSNRNNVARKEEDYWTIFNRENGHKIRFSFFNKVAPEKSISPELADIKITDFCPYNCSFCYQDSTIKGQHASMESIKFIADELEKAQVFEICAGGGETTLHPNFVEILKLFKDKKIIPNFTTKNLNLLRQSNAKQILEHCGAMAFSVESVEDMYKVKSAFLDCSKKDMIESTSYAYLPHNLKTSIWNPKLTFQVVMGTMPMKEFKSMLELASSFGSRITLLGYKENGRGNTFAPHDYSNWLELVVEMKKQNRLVVSIDTALASEYEKELLKKGVEENTFHTTEGTFSVYIDATKMTVSPSSYVGLEQTQDFDSTWLEKYKSMKAKPVYQKMIKIRS